MTDEAKKWILNQTLTDRSYGARPLRRALQKYIEDPLSEALIQGTITTRPAFIEVFLDGNKLFYRPVDAREDRGRAAVRIGRHQQLPPPLRFLCDRVKQDQPSAKSWRLLFLDTISDEVAPPFLRYLREGGDFDLVIHGLQMLVIQLYGPGVFPGIKPNEMDRSENEGPKQDPTQVTRRTPADAPPEGFSQ